MTAGTWWLLDVTIAMVLACCLGAGFLRGMLFALIFGTVLWLLGGLWALVDHGYDCADYHAGDYSRYIEECSP